VWKSKKAEIMPGVLQDDDGARDTSKHEQFESLQWSLDLILFPFALFMGWISPVPYQKTICYSSFNYFLRFQTHDLFYVAIF
jgi:hypothetical protein